MTTSKATLAAKATMTATLTAVPIRSAKAALPDLPIKPCGYQVLIKMQVPQAKSKGGIFLPDDSQDAEAMKKARGQVVALGPDAYHGSSNGAPRFPTGPYCEVGDWIEWNRYQERRIHIGDEEYAFVHDDRVLGNWGKGEPNR